MIVTQDPRLQAMIAIIGKVQNLSDDSGDKLDIRYGREGFLFHSFNTFTNGHMYVSLRPAIFLQNLVLEFETQSEIDSGLPAIVRVDDMENVDMAAQVILNWFALKDGHLFNVKPNGELPAYGVYRGHAKTYLAKPKD